MEGEMSALKSNFKRVELDPKATALVIVDMENDFCKPGGKKYHPDGADEVIPKLRGLLERCRAAGVQVIFLQSIRYVDSPEFARFGKPPFILKNTWGSTIIDELTPGKGEPVVEKNTHDCFYKTRMDSLLKRLRVLPETHTVIVTGIAASICVYHAVIGFHVRHYNVVVPLDCCADRPDGRKILETQMLRSAYDYNVTVTDSEMMKFR
jgi:nicotinamidase-related amidase